MTTYKSLSAVIGIALMLVGVLFVAVPARAEAYQYSYTPTYQYTNAYQYANNQQQVLYLLQVLAQLQAQLEALLDEDDRDYDDDSEIDITTRSADDVEDERARLRGEVDFNSSDYAYVWFEWGEDEDDLDENTPHIRIDDDEDEDFSARITDLDEDERYYFRAVGEDEDGEVAYGSIRNFRTDDDDHNDDDDAPDVETGDADDITEDSVELNGEVDMNDFRNGLVFFIYGEDEDQVEDVEDDYDTYDDVDEDGDDLQKHRADSDLDSRASYQFDIYGLDEDTEYFYTICVEYEDEDDDEVLVCGNVEDFETDED